MLYCKQLLPGGSDSDKNMHLLRLILVAMSQTFNDCEGKSTACDNFDESKDESINIGTLLL